MIAIKTIKVAFIGDSAVGKTTILKFYFGEDYQAVTTTPGLDFYIKKLEERSVVFWDFAGQVWYRDLIVQMLTGAQIVVMIFDLSRPNTLVSLIDFWLEQVLKHCGGGVPVVVVGHKKDISKMDRETVEEALKIIGARVPVKGYLETTIKDADTISALFSKVFDIAKEV